MDQQTLMHYHQTASPFNYVDECVGVARSELLVCIALITCCGADVDAVDRGAPDSGCVHIG